MDNSKNTNTLSQPKVESHTKWPKPVAITVAALASVGLGLGIEHKLTAKDKLSPKDKTTEQITHVPAVAPKTTKQAPAVAPAPAEVGSATSVTNPRAVENTPTTISSAPTHPATSTTAGPPTSTTSSLPPIDVIGGPAPNPENNYGIILAPPDKWGEIQHPKNQLGNQPPNIPPASTP